MDSTAVKEIQDSTAAIALAPSINKTHVPIAALPSNFTIHSLEKYQPNRSRFRGVFATHHLDSFASYHESVCTSAPVYVDPDEMAALAVFDQGTVEAPGHREHRARLNLQPTAPFKSLRKLAEKPEVSQRDLAEWIEDWREYIIAIGSDDQRIEPKALIATVRNITIEALRKSDSSEADFSSSRTALEKIEAKSDSGALPKLIIFTCEPYKDLPPQDFRLRMSIRTGSDKPSFKILRIQEELDTETTAENFVDLLKNCLDVDAQIYQGEFKGD